MVIITDFHTRNNRIERKTMEVYALVGKSGTGKSYQAINLCRDREIDGLIDDGLFIYENNIVAGISAKRQATKIGAVKTALFSKEDHQKQVAESIQKVAPRKMLIIGTSDAMVNQILNRLELPDFKEIIYIEDITTEEQREVARKQREELGKHIIPAATVQVKRQFSGYFVDPLRILKRFSTKTNNMEKTVVRPTFSYRGDYVIANKAIHDMIHIVKEQTKEIATVLWIALDRTDDGIHIRIIVNVKLGCKVLDSAKAFQKRVFRCVEQMTAFNVLSVDVEIRGLK